MTLRERLVEVDPEILLAYGFDEAFLGLVQRCGQPIVACYSAEAAIMVLFRKGMTMEEAEEYFNYNVVGAWVGERTPMFVGAF